MGVTATLLVLHTLILVCTGPLRAITQLVVQRVKQYFDERVSIVTVKLVLTTLPTTVLANVRAALRVVKEQIGWPAEVLLPMCVVAL